MLSIDPLLLIINRIPKYELTIHPSTGHKLQFRHGNHIGNHLIN